MCPPHLDSDVSFVFERLKICNRLNVFLTEMRWYLQVWPARAAVRGARDSLPLFRRECWSGSGPHIPGEIEGSSGECLRCHPCIVDRAPHRVMPAVPGLTLVSEQRQHRISRAGISSGRVLPYALLSNRANSSSGILL